MNDNDYGHPDEVEDSTNAYPDSDGELWKAGNHTEVENRQARQHENCIENGKGIGIKIAERKACPWVYFC